MEPGCLNNYDSNNKEMSLVNENICSLLAFLIQLHVSFNSFNLSENMAELSSYRGGRNRTGGNGDRTENLQSCSHGFHKPLLLIVL